MNEILTALLEKAIGQYRLNADEPLLRKQLLQIAYSLPKFNEQPIVSTSEPNESVHHIARLFNETIKQLETAQSEKHGLLDVPSGIESFDKELGGFMNGELVIIGGRPGMGKTCFLITLINNMATKLGIAAGIFSLESNEKSILLRLMAAVCNLRLFDLQTGKIGQPELERLQKAYQAFSQMPLYIDETPRLSISEFETKARHMVEKKNIKIIFLDNIQMLETDYGRSSWRNREAELSYISRRLKQIATELNIPLVVTSQLNRSVETRGGDKKPQLSDLRESGAIEQEADRVFLLYRPEYYGLTVDENGSSLLRKAELIVAKNRFGIITSIMLEADAYFNVFFDAENELSSINITDRMEDFLDTF